MNALRGRYELVLDDDLIGCPEAHIHKVVQSDPYAGISAPGVLDELKTELAAICRSHGDLATLRWTTRCPESGDPDAQAQMTGRSL
jgi:hypothetical protein